MKIEITAKEANIISTAFAQLARVYNQIATRATNPVELDDDLLFNVNGEVIQAPATAPATVDDLELIEENPARGRRYFGRTYKRDGFITDNVAAKRFGCSYKDLTRATRAVKVQRHNLNGRGSHYFISVADLPFIEAYFRMNA